MASVRWKMQPLKVTAGSTVLNPAHSTFLNSKVTCYMIGRLGSSLIIFSIWKLV